MPMRHSQTLGITIPSLTILGRLSPIAICHLLHICAPSPWRPATRIQLTTSTGYQKSEQRFSPNFYFLLWPWRCPSQYSLDEEFNCQQVQKDIPNILCSLVFPVNSNIFYLTLVSDHHPHLYIIAFSTLELNSLGPDALETSVILHDLRHSAVLQRKISCWTS